ncbi:Short-chain dehydrogenase [Austwickia chelonae]|uniref:Putative oxidoreductase n=1 Tax=Austwickia chelonae NBRC 105200 TaxID=1184607 RepID=K6UNI8_9MICO|nr:SDR family NAD(P)-dependent oxidoreductase [Austwickia chelonae]GAB79006.1 putative oxidoreductase [Austwickia chelonae NBRC 105200]SEW41603.1 Short-chain dehydrogenase [Austwickia chelonae]
MEDPPENRTRSILITGAARGLGAAAAERFLAGGWRVAAADLTAPDLGNRTTADILTLDMDVTQDDSVTQALHRIEEWTPHGLDAVTTFAGVTGIGPLMDTPTQNIHRILDVNVLGTHRTIQASWQLVRRAGGRIILIGSETGRQHAMPMNGAYAMSKHAIEAYADALRRELMFVGIDVTLMQPGPFRTEMTSRITATFDAVPDDSPFKPLARAARARVAEEDAKASDPSVLAEAVFHAATARRARTRYPVRLDRGRELLDRLPTTLVDRILRRSLTRIPVA